jgi:hypothetical protein
MDSLSERTVGALVERGFARLGGRDTLALLANPPAAAWAAFAASWDELGQDGYMADGGRYRWRRHGVFTVIGDRVERQAHQPHFQSRDYNRLNGDIQRWFEPITPATAANPVLTAVFERCGQLFAAAARRPAGPWRVEAHQFRIEATPTAIGRPTPEGFHRDGVDWVFVMLVERRNVAEGVTELGDADGRPLGSFTLTQPGDAILLDDARILHGVTAIRPLNAQATAFRDALVVTFQAE